MFLSVLDVFKIGIGPSSSHTMGPMSAANRFIEELRSGDFPRARNARPAAVSASLHGSLAFTGPGHGSGHAVIAGLCGESPTSIDPDGLEALIETVERTGSVTPPGLPPLRFRPSRDLVYDRKAPLPLHPNGMRFTATDEADQLLVRRVYYSVGGGFVLREDEMGARDRPAPSAPDVPYPFATAAEMLSMARATGLSIAALKRANEEAQMGRVALEGRLDAIWDTMSSSIDRGLSRDGIMPGGLGVRRRAKAIAEGLEADWARNHVTPLAANDWLSVYAMAVNEENAAGGRIVTAPTNGAAGVVPAVMRYHLRFEAGAGRRAVHDFLLTAAAIGGLIKHNASISGAEVGCQGEVGSASAMAAAGLCAVRGGTPAQVENAAEIALEHHLGMTCDPVGGLVQIPCIERNAFGAVKAVTAASLALKGDGVHRVPLDNCIETMRQTGADMSERYKETSLGGLAVNLPEC